jgi:hypothetical protein
MIWPNDFRFVPRKRTFEPMFASHVEVIKLINYLIHYKLCIYETLSFFICFICRKLVSAILFGINLLYVFKFQFTGFVFVASCFAWTFHGPLF